MEKLQGKLREAERDCGDAKDEAEAKSVRGRIILSLAYASSLFYSRVRTIPVGRTCCLFCCRVFARMVCSLRPDHLTGVRLHYIGPRCSASL